MAKGHVTKIKGMHANSDRKARGRTSITGTTARDLGPRKTNPNTPLELRSEASRPQGPGAGKHRGDRRDMSKLYTNNARHKARGNNPRPDVSTRKR